MDNELAERLAKVESHLAHLERLYEQLNEVVIDQGKRMAKLQTQLQRVGQSLETIETERIKATNPKPPHYSA
jgi:SlyX protein